MAHFVCVGSGSRSEDLAALIAENALTDRIHLPGQVSPVAPWMKACDLFLNTSVIEGMPNVVIEAQSLGVPVVATDAGGTSEVLLDGVTGRLVPPDDCAALVEASVAILTDQAFLDSAAVAATNHIAANFSITVMRDRTLGIYGYGLPEHSTSDRRKIA